MMGSSSYDGRTHEELRTGTDVSPRGPSRSSVQKVDTIHGIITFYYVHDLTCPPSPEIPVQGMKVQTVCPPELGVSRNVGTAKFVVKCIFF